MITGQQLTVWERIETFPLDAPGATFPFSAKLARETGWDAGYVSRVIEEYRRFAFLAVVAGHPVSPSEAVDQAWHLHLTYTESYWKRFCPEALGMEFHHHPSAGGEMEKSKFADWYSRTLESYHELFGENPPSDIWPAPGAPKVIPPQLKSHDPGAHWVIRKPRLRPELAAIPMIGVLVWGCATASGSMNPYDLRGPEFLFFYLALAATLTLVARAVRTSLSVPTAGPETLTPPLDPYEIASLNGGPVLVLNTIVANLVGQGYLTVDPKNRNIACTDPTYKGQNPLEGAVLSAAGSGIALPRLRTAFRGLTAHIEDRLKDRGLMVSNSQVGLTLTVPFLVASLAPMYGVGKVLVGLDRGKPVAFLVGLIVMGGILNVWMFLSRPKRSRYGDKILERLQTRYRGNWLSPGSNRTAIPSDITFGVALFGLGVLAGTPLGGLDKALKPPANSSTCSTSVGCGGSSGDGGGGGGCGGGGCGGCGS